MAQEVEKLKEEVKIQEEENDMAKSKIEKKSAEMAQEVEKLKEEETKTITIPIDPLNPTDLEVIVGVNEKYAKIIRGEETKVSIPVYEVLKNSKLI